MKWTHLVAEIETAFMYAYGVFVAWSLVKWVRTVGSIRPTLRDWLGSSGVVCGICSATLYAWFYAYLWMEGRLIAHGSALILYEYAGGLLAGAGLLSGLAGRGWVRQSALIISLVMVFQWYGTLLGSRKGEAVQSIAMFVLLAVWGIVFLGSKWLMRRVAAAPQ